MTKQENKSRKNPGGNEPHATPKRDQEIPGGLESEAHRERKQEQAEYREKYGAKEAASGAGRKAKIRRTHKPPHRS